MRVLYGGLRCGRALLSRKSLLSHVPHQDHHLVDISSAASSSYYYRSRAFHHEAFQNVLEAVHQSTGLDYWKLIVLGTFGIRTLITLPLNLYQRVLMKRWKSIVLEDMKKWKTDYEPVFLREAKRARLSYAQYQEKWKTHVYEKSRSLFKEYGFHPWKLILLPSVQIPLFITLSLILRNVLYHSPTMKYGGLLWFQDLTVPDPTFLFPIAIATTHLINIEVLASSRDVPINKPTSTAISRMMQILHRWSLFFGRFLSLIMIPMTCYVPSGIAIYWFTSSLYSVLQNVLLNRLLENRSPQQIEGIQKSSKSS